MATPGRPLPEQTRRAIRRLEDAGLSRREIARQLRVSTRTVHKYVYVESKPTLAKRS